MGAYDCDCINNLEYEWRERKAQLSKKDTTKDTTSDMISRQAAIDLFPNDVLEWDTLNGYIAPHVARRLIEQLPPAQPEPQWIPVSERLPEESGYYITSNEYCGVNEDFYYDGHFWNADKNAYEVLAWMPKPEHCKPNK